MLPILTITTCDWLPTHFARWCRTLRHHMPLADVGVLVVGPGEVGAKHVAGCRV